MRTSSKSRSTRIGSLAFDPIDLFGGRVEAGLDAAVVLLDGGLADQLVRRRSVEISFDLRLHGRLIAFQRQQKVGFVRDDLGGDVDLTPYGVDGDERAFELPRLGQPVEQDRDGGDLIGLLGDAELRQDEARVGRVGAERMQGFEALAAVVGATRRLAVDGDQIVTTRPHRADPIVETTREGQGIDPIHQGAQPPFARNSVMERREFLRKSR